MDEIINLLRLFLMVSFSVYGASCFISSHIKSEFIRYQMQPFRKLVGFAQLISALGLLIGINNTLATVISGIVLSGMMIGAIGVRIKIRDDFFKTLPAIIYFLISTLFLWLVSVQIS